MPGIAGDGFLIPSIPRRPVPAAGSMMMLHRYLAQLLGWVIHAASAPQHGGSDLQGVAGSWGQTPGLAAPHILL